MNAGSLNTCKGCDASWKGNRMCHCSACHQTFSTINLFDLHRSQNGEHGSCKNPEEVRKNGGSLVLMEGVWKSRGPESDQAWYSKNNYEK